MGKKSYRHGRGRSEKRKNEDGTPNTKYVDVLEVDRPLAGQNFGCFSFISPEKIIQQRETYFFAEFLKNWEISKSMEKYHQFLNFISFKYRLKFDEVIVDFEDFLKEERENIIQLSSLNSDYKTFLDNHEHELEKKFSVEHDFQTSVRGFKSRGNFSTQEEAELRAKMLREADPCFDVYVGPVGTWLPWEPDAYKTGRVEYLEDELNQLAHEKKNNEQSAKNAFELRVKETKQKAIDENKKNAEKYDGKVTQDVDEDGNLIGLGIASQERAFCESKSITVDELKNELFEGDNVITSIKTDHGQSELISGPFATTNDENNE